MYFIIFLCILLSFIKYSLNPNVSVGFSIQICVIFL